MSDETNVTDRPDPQGPTLEDVAEVVSRTNRGILALERMHNELFGYVCAMFTLLFGILLVMCRRLAVI